MRNSPMPEFPPVTSITLPVKSGVSFTENLDLAGHISEITSIWSLNGMAAIVEFFSCCWYEVSAQWTWGEAS